MIPVARPEWEQFVRRKIQILPASSPANQMKSRLRLPFFLLPIALLAGCSKQTASTTNKTSSKNASKSSASTGHIKTHTSPPLHKPLTAQQLSNGLAVLTWHRIAEHPAQYTVTTPTKFAQELAVLHDAGANVMRIEDAVKRVKAGIALPPRAVALCFDDGFKTCYTEVFPWLKHYHWPATLYVYPDWISSGGGALSWDELKEMQASHLVDVQSHTMGHPNLLKMRPKHGMNYEQRLHHELFDSKTELEQKLGIKVTQLAYPYGYYNKHIMSVAKQAGYDSVWAVRASPFRARFAKGETWMNLPRYLIYRDDSIQKFTRYAFGKPLKVVGLSPNPNSTNPNTMPTISARLGESVDPKSVQMRLALIKEVSSTYNPKTHIVSFKPSSPLREGTWTVSVSATDKKGNFKIASWDFIVGQPTPTPDPTDMSDDATATATVKPKPKTQP